jgi:hypothetical protein
MAVRTVFAGLALLALLIALVLPLPPRGMQETVMADNSSG